MLRFTVRTSGNPQDGAAPDRERNRTMATSEQVPAPAIRRLSLYLRQLESFELAGRQTVSSRDLGQALGLSDAQVRKDLGYFGQFGQPGVGYRVSDLLHRVRCILGTDKTASVVLVGVGNLGRALIAYRGFAKRGFPIVGAFDSDPGKIGRPIPGPNPLIVRPLEDLPIVVRERSVRVGLLAVPASAGQHVAKQMVEAGIRGILNFAPVILRLGDDVSVASVDLSVHLEQLAFQVGTVAS